LVLLFSSLCGAVALCALNPQRKEQPNQHSLFICRLGRQGRSNQHFFSLPILKRREKRNVWFAVGRRVQIGMNQLKNKKQIHSFFVVFVSSSQFTPYCYNIFLINSFNSLKWISFPSLKRKVIFLLVDGNGMNWKWIVNAAAPIKKKVFFLF